MTPDEIKVRIYRYIDAYNTFNIDSMLDALGSDVKFENISAGQVNARTSGKAEFEILARRSARMFAHRKQTLRAIQVEGEKAFAEIEFEGVLAQDLPGGLKAGQKIVLRGTTEFVFKNGLISLIIDRS